MWCAVRVDSRAIFFFIIYMNDIKYATNLFEMIIYADDTTLYTTISSNNNLEQEINNELNAINDWLKSNRLSLNITKTKAM